MLSQVYRVINDDELTFNELLHCTHWVRVKKLLYV